MRPIESIRQIWMNADGGVEEIFANRVLGVMTALPRAASIENRGPITISGSQQRR
jgi:hypothetical protein